MSLSALTSISVCAQIIIRNKELGKGMNKSEREKMTLAIAQMLHSYDSPPEVITWGQSLLESFPFLENDVNEEAKFMHIENLAKMIRSRAIDYNGLNSSPTKLKEFHENLKPGWHDDISDTVIDYVTENNIDAQELAYEIDTDSSEIWILALEKVFHDPKWKVCLAYYFPDRLSLEFRCYTGDYRDENS